MKGSWKRRGISEDRIRTVLRTSRSMSAAAKTLGVNRSTLHRWVEADPKLKAARDVRAVTQEAVVKQAESMTADKWAESVRRSYELTPTEAVILNLAHQALEIAQNENEKPSDRLSAMGRFQRLVQDLDLPTIADEDKQSLYAV